MTDIIITGACGKMGKVIQSIVANRDDCRVIAGVDLYDDGKRDFPVYKKFAEMLYFLYKE